MQCLTHALTSSLVSEKPQEDWDNEGGASAPEPTQKTPKGLEIPVPKRKDVMASLRKLVQPEKKP
jgi:hypothetical protein